MLVFEQEEDESVLSLQGLVELDLFESDART